MHGYAWIFMDMHRYAKNMQGYARIAVDDKRRTSAKRKTNIEARKETI